MMTDLFSSLDGGYLLTWAVPVAVIFLVTRGWKNGVFNSVVLAASKTTQKALPSGLTLASLLLSIVVLNFAGLLPLVYGPTSSLWFASTLALVGWGSLLISGWAFAPRRAAAHFAPLGAPAPLMPFLVLVETVSAAIRPITLSVRLIANISAGHIVLSLVANQLSSLGWGLLSLPISVGYTLFEFFVCAVQAYIFTLLVSLYLDEHPSCAK